MGLQKDQISSTGLLVENAYFKVDEYSCGKDNVINARLRAYVSKEFADNGASALEGSEDVINLTADYSDKADNTKKQIYEFVKKTEKYSDAIDC